MTAPDSRRHTLILVTIAVVVLLTGFFLRLEQRVDSDIPLPFSVSSGLQGAITEIGRKGGKSVTSITFALGETKETLPQNALSIVVLQGDAGVSDGAPLSVALVPSKRIFGYKYTSRDATAERAAASLADVGTPLPFPEMFPGQFFVSAEARTDEDFIGGFEDQGIIFAPMEEVTLEQNSRYVFLALDAGTDLTVRGLAWCGDGVTTAGCRPGMGDIIIDDGDPGFAAEGPWVRKMNVGWDSDRLAVPALNSSICTFGANCTMMTNARVSWTFNSLPSAVYEVYVKWRNPEDLRPPSMHRVLDGANQVGSVAFPWTSMEKDASGHWGKLGSYSITSGTLKVETTNSVGWMNSQYPAEVIADAVMIRRSICGDGVPEGGEQCDDGGVSSGDGCSAMCTMESGYSSCSGTPSVCVPIVCGDGKIEQGEECDDGDTDPGDGCSAACSIEADFRCAGEPSVCKPIIPKVTQSVLQGVMEPSIHDLIIGSDGNPIIALYDKVTGTVKLARCDNLSCSGTIVTSTVDSVGNIDTHLSMALGADELPIISYYDRTNTNLKVAHCGDLSCSSGNTLTTVDGEGEVGATNAIAIGADGLPVVVYYDSMIGHLKLARCRNITCSEADLSTIIVPVGTAAPVFRYVSLAIGTDGNPVIAFTAGLPNSSNDTNKYIRIFRCGNAACDEGNTSAIIASGFDPVLVIGTDGLPIVAYRNEYQYNSRVRVTHCGDVLCSAGNTISQINSIENAGRVSMGLGADGFPFLAYHLRGGSVASHDLITVHCGDVSCTLQNIVVATGASTGNVGENNAVAIGSNGLPVVSFSDSTLHSIRMLFCGDEECY